MVRSEEKGQQFKSHGMQVRVGDFNNATSLNNAVKGIKRALLISSNNLGHTTIDGKSVSNRYLEHKNFVDALHNSDASVELIAYTSLLRADTTPMLLAIDHKQTETYIADSGNPHSFLRNGWYIENTVEQIGSWAQHGSIIRATKNGRVSAASRKDYAEAAAKILLNSDSKSIKRSYELAGHPGYNLDELAALATKIVGKPIKAVHLSEQEYRGTLASFGLPEHLTKVVADAENQAASGALEYDTHDLEKLIGRDSESIEDVMKAVLQRLE